MTKENEQIPPEHIPTGSFKHDLFGDPNVARAMEEDPILRFFARHWVQMVIVVAVVIAGLYVKDRFIATHNASLGEAADLYTRVAGQFNAYQAALAERSDAAKSKVEMPADADAQKKADAEKKFTDAEAKVKESRRVFADALTALEDAREPYSRIATYYRGLQAAVEGEPKNVEQLYSGIKLPESSGESLSADALLGELKTLLLARTLIDQDESLERGRAMLKDLAKNGQLLNTVSAISLARIAGSPEQRKEALDIMQQITAAQPEQHQVLDDEIARLKA